MRKLSAGLLAAMMAMSAYASGYPETDTGFVQLENRGAICEISQGTTVLVSSCSGFAKQGLVREQEGTYVFSDRALAYGSSVFSAFEAAAKVLQIEAQRAQDKGKAVITLYRDATYSDDTKIKLEVGKSFTLHDTVDVFYTRVCGKKNTALSLYRRINRVQVTPVRFDVTANKWELKVQQMSTGPVNQLTTAKTDCHWTPEIETKIYQEETASIDLAAKSEVKLQNNYSMNFDTLSLK